jgi:hypothetical protein
LSFSSDTVVVPLAGHPDIYSLFPVVPPFELQDSFHSPYLMTRLGGLATDPVPSTVNDQVQPSVIGTPPVPSGATVGVLPPDVSESCEKCVDDYRKGTTEKADTFIKLQAIISQYAADDQADFAIQALRSYLSMLDNHDNLRNAAIGRGGQY